VLAGVALSWLASVRPDGLEWAVLKTSGKEYIQSGGKLHGLLASLQQKTAFLPDYGLKKAASGPAAGPLAGEASAEAAKARKAAWPAVEAGTSLAGLVGGALTLALALLVGFALKRRKAAA
jgi:cobalt/nickel transport system permease protein